MPHTFEHATGLDPFEVLDEEPRAAFFSFQDQFGRQGGNQRRFFSNRFQQIHDEFLGRLGGQLRQGQNPTQTFSSFLGDFNFGGRFQSTAPSLRGGPQQSQFAPPTRFDFGGGTGSRFGGF